MFDPLERPVRASSDRAYRERRLLLAVRRAERIGPRPDDRALRPSSRHGAVTREP